jgi:preprotein translocase SecE subunit
MGQMTESLQSDREVGGNLDNKFGQGKQFYRDVKLEMKKVAWPTRQEVQSTTLVVLIAVFFFGFFLWGVDVLISLAFNALTDLFK